MSRLLRDTEVLRDAKRALREGRHLPNAAELAKIADALGQPRLAAELRARPEAGSGVPPLTDPALDFSVEAMSAPTVKPRSPWGIGGSEIALAMLTLGIKDPATAPAWMRERAELSKRHRCPKWVGEKVGLLAKRQDDTMRRGTLREPDVLAAWLERLSRDEWQCDDERDVDPASVMWAGALPSEWPPFRDRLSPLTVKPDAWGRTWAGELVTISIKAARYGFSKPAWWNGIDEAPWYYAAQLHGEHATLSSKRALLVVGCGWNRDPEDPRSDGPIRVFPVRRDESEISTVRDVARRAWALVEPRVMARA